MVTLQSPLGFFLIALAIVLISGLLLNLLLKRIGLRRKANLPNPRDLLLRHGLTLSRRPLLTEPEAALFNMIQLAVQDHYLVFPQVPLWAVVKISSQDPEARKALLRRLAFRRVDFALVHPGSLRVAKAVAINRQDQVSPQNRTRKEVLEEVLKAAKIEVITLQAGKTYALTDLSKMLGASAEEEGGCSTPT